MLLSAPNPIILDTVISADKFPLKGRGVLYNKYDIPVIGLEDIVMKRNDSRIYFTKICFNPQLIDLNKYTAKCFNGDIFRAQVVFFNNSECGGLRYFYKVGEYIPDENGGHGFLSPATTEDKDAVFEFYRGEIISMPVDD